MDHKTDRHRETKGSGRPCIIGCVSAVLITLLILIGGYYCLYGIGDTTVYAKGYTEVSFRSIKAGMTSVQVKRVLGEPLDVSQHVVFTRALVQNSHQTFYCSFADGAMECSSNLLDGRSKGKTVSSVKHALSLLTPQERKLAVIQYVWWYAKPGAPLSQRHKWRSITFDASGIVLHKSSSEWID